jgi:hypothetical protein
LTGVKFFVIATAPGQDQASGEQGPSAGNDHVRIRADQARFLARSKPRPLISDGVQGATLTA